MWDVTNGDWQSDCQSSPAITVWDVTNGDWQSDCQSSPDITVWDVTNGDWQSDCQSSPDITVWDVTDCVLLVVCLISFYAKCNAITIMRETKTL